MNCLRVSTCLTSLILFISLLCHSQIPSGGLIGAWPFTGNANDVSGSNNHGTPTGGAVLTSDRCGNPNSAYLFNGTTAYLQMLAVGPTGNASRSISFWAKTTHTQVNSPRSAFDYGTALGTGDSYQIVWSYCALGVGLDLSNQALIRGNACLYNNTWHHIVAVYNSSLSNVYNTVVYYIDGVAQPAIVCNVSGTNATINTGTVFPITVGRGATSATRYFNGAIDDVYLYNRPLTAAEVLQLYTVLPTCPPAITGNTMVCSGSYQTYSVSPISNATYTWTFPFGWSGTSTSNTIGVQAGSMPGTISVAASSSCGAFPTATLAVSTLPLPTLTVTTSHSIACAGLQVTLTASGANAYSWTPGGLTGSVVLVNPMVNTTYSIHATNSSSCSQTFTFTQNVVLNPTVNASSSGSVACNGQSVSLTGSGAISYTWMPGNLNGAVVSVTPASSTLYALVGTTPFGCTASHTVFVPVASPLSLNLSAASFTACPGNNILITANVSGGTPPYSYQWSNGINSTSSAYQSSVSLNTTASVAVQDANSCAISASTPINFVVVGSLNTSTVSICPNTVATLTVSGSNTYTWLPFGAGGNTYSMVTSTPQQFTIEATSLLGCLTSTTTFISIKPAPLLSFNTFSITCGSLGSATVVASGGTGPFSYTWTPTGQTSSVATGLFPGNYTLTFLDAGTGCIFTPTTNFLPLVPLTGTVSATPSLQCFGATTGSASIALSGGSGTQTYTWTNSTGSQTSSVALGLAAGVSTVQVLDALTYCPVTHTFFITQPPALTVQITPSSASVCLGGSLSFTASNSGGIPPYTYTWVSGPASPQMTVSESSTGTFVYMVNSLDANLCPSQHTIGLSFVPNPTISVSTVSICPLESGTLSALGASTYTWSNGATGSTLIASPATNTQYTVVGSALSCTSSATASIVLKPLPVATAYNNGPICSGQTLLLASSGGSPQWTGPLNYTSSIQNPSLSPGVYGNSGIYTVKVTAGNSCTASAVTSVSVHPIPGLNVLGSHVCEGQPLLLNSFAQSGSSYYWQGPHLYTSSLPNPTLASSTPSMSGLYTLTLLSSNGCTNQAVAFASVSPQPVVNIIGTFTLCENDTLQAGATGADSYYWQTPFGNNFYTASFTLVNVNAGISGIYTLTAVKGICQSFSTIPVTIHPLPVPTASNNGPVCESGNLLLLAGSAASYTWSGPQGFQSNLQQPSINSISLLNAGIYNLSITDQQACKASAQTTVEVLLNPVVSVSSETVCLGENAQLSASGGVSYHWLGPAGFSSTLSSIVIPQVSTLTAGYYSVTVSAQNNCTVQVAVPLTAFPYELPQPLIFGNPHPCLNTPLVLTGSGGVSYLWLGPNNFSTSVQQLSVSSVSASSAGAYTLSVTNTSFCTATATVEVNVLPLPKAELSGSVNKRCVPFCSEFRLQFDSSTLVLKGVSTLFNGQTYTTTGFNLCFNTPGQFSINSVFIDANDCVNNSVVLLDAYPNVLADFYFKPDQPLAGIDLVDFLNTSQGPSQSVWNWFFMANNKDTVFTENCSFLFEQAGKYPVALVVKNQFGCADTVVKTVVIDEDFALYVPNSFTPNGDGTNDLFQAKGVGISDFKLLIFDRWGELIYHTNSFYNGWDGYFKGVLCQNGLYNWKIELKTSQGQTKNKIGTVQLIR